MRQYNDCFGAFHADVGFGMRLGFEHRGSFLSKVGSLLEGPCSKGAELYIGDLTREPNLENCC